ncbi:39S ribosomal protein L18-like protein [Dinothrombium tinctorium]|uniref:39S ribosomal protein L18-like protein n=1 Tax=Dinothrombium tinctorium TaxID=1965070 RepID=A0A3S4RHM5_9ACAR|nr:39S ribosomal protein L18-like protein [Dinothrombium tinctorium]
MSLKSVFSKLAKNNFWKVSSIRLNAAIFPEGESRDTNTRCPLTITCRWSYIVKKRITRIPSDIEFEESEIADGQRSSNDKPPVRLVNRNPRNLEQLQFERKPLGFELDSPSISFWNKVVFDQKGKHMVASVLHHSGYPFITVSSNELNNGSTSSPKDVNTAVNMGVILARRCLESGVLYVHSEYTADELKSLKVQAFIKALQDNGLILKEPNFIFPRRKRDL